MLAAEQRRSAELGCHLSALRSENMRLLQVQWAAHGPCHWGWLHPALVAGKPGWHLLSGPACRSFSEAAQPHT